MDKGQSYIDVLYNINSGLKGVKLNGCTELEQIKSAYRSIFGEEYAKDSNKEIIATQLKGSRISGMKNFLEDRGCCWIDFIGCDSFSEKKKKQIFFATVSRTKEIFKQRSTLLESYSALVSQEIPIDIFVQLFFTDKNLFLERLKSKDSINKIDKVLERVQENGFVIPLASPYYGDCKKQSSDDDSPFLLDVYGYKKISQANVHSESPYYLNNNQFIEEITALKERKKNLSLYIEMEYFLRKVVKHQDLPDLVKVVTKFNKSLYPKEVKLLYFIPNHCPDGAVGLFCYGSNRLLTKKELDELKLLSFNILYPYVSSYKSAWENKQVVKESIKSAVSAIMSRNMSHNLGSHYLYYTKAYLENIALNSEENGPDIRGAAKVLGYIQARMDYLATVISNDKYPYGAVNFKSQIYDELTIDDFSHRHFLKDDNCRTVNFLLANLIKSEGFTRPDVKDNAERNPPKELSLHVKLCYDTEKDETFTGSWHRYSSEIKDKEGKVIQHASMRQEKATKIKISQLNLALPGGPMACHAVFNVIENFIRNSAKYLQADLKPEGLVCTIALLTTKNNYCNLVIYDNKLNANIIVSNKNETLYDTILHKLANLKVLDEDNRVSKEDKGFKEMLFSSIWLRPNQYEDSTFADVIAEIDRTEPGQKKLDCIEQYGFRFVKVSTENKDKIKVYERSQEYDKECNLGIMLQLPLYNKTQKFELTDKINIGEILDVRADIVEVNERYMQNEDLRNIFTRPLSMKDDGLSLLNKYKEAIKLRFKEIEQFKLAFGEKDGITKESGYDDAQEDHKIYFHRHIDSEKDINDYLDYAYADSVSGGNFTVTLAELFKNGMDKQSHYCDEDAEIFALKIKESALTRVTIIDERLFESYNEKYGNGGVSWLPLRNVRIQNYKNEQTIHDVAEGMFNISNIFEGSSFGDGKDETHFLTIHLGLIEKILKNSVYVNDEIDKRIKNANRFSLDKERVGIFMKLLEENYAFKEGPHLYVAVHSGRGNYSKELGDSLCRYPFIGLAALESAYNNSKFQLTQLLYDTVYIGKGYTNSLINK